MSDAAREAGPDARTTGETASVGPSASRLTARPLSFSARLVLAMLALTLLTAAGVGLLTFVAVERARLPGAVERLRADVATHSRTLSVRADHATATARVLAGATMIREAVRTLSEGGDLSQGLRAALERDFSAVLAANRDLVQVRLIALPLGREIVRIDRGPADAAVPAPTEALQDKSARPYVTVGAQLAPGGVHVSGIDLNREHGRPEDPPRPVMRVVAPLNAASGERVGLLVVNLDVRATFEAFRMGRPENVALYVLNEDGDFLLHPDRSMEFLFEYGEPYRMVDDHPAVAAKVASADAGAATLQARAGRPLLVAWETMRLGGTPRGLVVETWRPDAIRARLSAGGYALVGATLAGAIAALIALLLARSFARPLATMARDLNDAPAGEALRLPIYGERRLSALARAIEDHAERERWTGAMFQNAGEAIVGTSPDGIVVRWNPAAERLLGLSAASAIGRNVEATSATAGPTLGRLLRLATTGSAPEAHEVSTTLADGRHARLSVSAFAVRASDGTLLGASALAHDVTDQREAEELLRLTVEYSTSAKLLVDETGTVVLVNAEAEERFALPREAIVGDGVARLLPDLAEAVGDCLALPDGADRSAGEGPPDREASRRRAVGRRPNGETFPCEVTLTRIARRDGALVLIALLDLTEHERIARELRERTAELERSNADLTQFAYVASHDLQEPLRAVASFTQLLAERYSDVLDERGRSYIAFAVDGARRMRALIDDLLIYSRVGSQPHERAATDVGALWADVLRQLGPAIREAGVAVETGSLPPALADPAQLGRVLQNLLSNALKFKSDKTPRVIFEGVREGDEVTYSMRDNGIGFEPRDAERIFEMFQRTHERGRYDGTGLGLSIAKRVIELHDGRIWASGRPGEGATFTFSLRAPSGGRPS